MHTLLERTLADLDWLVKHDTSQPKPNRPLADKLAERLERIGGRIRLTASDDGTRANVLASFGPDRAGGIVLSGHTDVVTVEGQAWATDPFRAVVTGTRVRGRGVADMKGFIACCLSVIEEFQWSRLKRPIHLALSYDEEIGCLGAPRLVADLMANLAPPRLCIVGEPTSLEVVPAHKGAFVFETVFRGREAHSSRPELGRNANHLAAEFVSFLGRLFERERAADAAAGLPELLRTSYNVGILSGGTALNITAGRCRAVWEFRPSFRADAAKIVEEIELYLAAKSAEAGEELPVAEGRTLAAVPPLRERNGAALALLADVVALPRAEPVAYGTEAGFFDDAGVPTVVCGPGSIEQAHQPDEFVEIDQLRRCVTMLTQVVRSEVLQ